MKREVVKKLRRGQKLTVDEIDFVAEEFTNKRDYGLVWENHPESVDLELKDGYFDIKEVKKKRILTNPDGRDNLLIEGDNLHSLMALKEAGLKVDVIYIDPPYNTSNNDFIFNDKIVNKEDAYRHSKWLSFMSKRLELARDLLSDDGVIFVSIDDNEQANLRLLMDQIFGEENFITNSIRQVKGGASHDSKYLSVEYEYLLIYIKSNKLEGFSQQDADISEKKYNRKDKHFKTRGSYYLRSLQYKGSSKKRSNWKVKLPNNKMVLSDFNNKDGYEWRWGEEKFLWGLKNDFIEFVEDENNDEGYNIYIKQYQYVDNQGNPYKRTIPYSAYMKFLNSAGTKDIKSVKLDFDYPKPKDFIKHVVKLHPNKNATVLDFFAGSGTTGQAVMELNKEDGGNRRFILCTNNENNICEEITYERNRRVIFGEYAEGQFDPLPNNLSYYKVNIKNIDTLSIDEKKELDLRKNIYSILWKNEYNIVEKNDKYLIAEKKEEKAAILLANTIDDNMRKAIEGSADCIYIPKHLSRDKILKMFCDKEVVYY